MFKRTNPKSARDMMLWFLLGWCYVLEGLVLILTLGLVDCNLVFEFLFSDVWELEE